MYTYNFNYFYRVEKLLDLLDELVDDKMWKRIMYNERPNANNYQHKITTTAHKNAEQMNGKVSVSGFGKFKVNSLKENKFYIVSRKSVCDTECRTLFCIKCKICWHRYQCECPEYTVKNALCKHIHAVAIFEQRSESVLDPSTSRRSEDNLLYINLPGPSQAHYQENLVNFIQERCCKGDTHDTFKFEQKREVFTISKTSTNF